MAFKIFRKNCCGLDVHKTWIYACMGITDTNGRTEYKQARFSSFTKGLQKLADWLAKYDCNDVCMESTGKFWIPVFNILEKTCWVTLAYLDTYESTHDYDEYHFDLDEIEHDPYVLLSLLCALHEGQWTISTAVPIPAAAIRSISRKRMTTITASGMSLPGC